MMIMIVIGGKVELRERSKIIPGSSDLELDRLVLAESEFIYVYHLNILRSTKRDQSPITKLH